MTSTNAIKAKAMKPVVVRQVSVPLL
jgi:hypothetical protein